MADERKNIVLHGELTNRENILRYRKMDCCEYMLDDISVDHEKIRNNIVIHVLGFLLVGLAYFANIPVIYRDSFFTNGTPGRLLLIIVGFIVVIAGKTYLLDKCEFWSEVVFLTTAYVVSIAILCFMLLSWFVVAHPGFLLALFLGMLVLGQRGDSGPVWAFSPRFGSFFLY